MRGKFYFGIVDDLGLDSIAEMELNSPIGVLEYRARANMHRNAKVFNAQLSDEIFERIVDLQLKGKSIQAKNILFRDAIYLSLRKESRINTELFKREGLAYFGKLKMVEKL